MIIEGNVYWLVEANGNAISVLEDFKGAKEIAQQYANLYDCKVRLRRIKLVVDRESIVIYPKRG